MPKTPSRSPSQKPTLSDIPAQPGRPPARSRPVAASKGVAKPASKAAAARPQRAKPAVPPSAPSKVLDVFPNPAPERDYVIRFDVPEFTCLCPLTGQPDFANFRIEIVPDQWCVELKSLKMFFWTFRNEGAFHEKVTNAIAEHIAQAIHPRFIRIHADWFVRGGIRTFVTVEQRAPGWQPPVPVVLPA